VVVRAPVRPAPPSSSAARRLAREFGFQIVQIRVVELELPLEGHRSGRRRWSMAIALSRISSKSSSTSYADAACSSSYSGLFAVELARCLWCGKRREAFRGLAGRMTAAW